LLTSFDDMSGAGGYYTSQLANDVSKFSGATLAYVYTGMTFSFGNIYLEILMTPSELYIDGNPGNFNNTSIVSRIYGSGNNTLSMIFLADAAKANAEKLFSDYRYYLQSAMCQISHHGVEDFPLDVYEVISAAILWYPCNNSLYNLTNRDADVRKALRESSITIEILLRQNALYTRYLNPRLNPDPVEKPK